MFRYSLNRLVFRNRGFLFHVFNNNFVVRTSNMLISQFEDIFSKVPKYWNRNFISVRWMNTYSSQIRQNYHEECEDGINKQINLELYASYVYMTMAYHFDRDDVALKNVSKYFKKYSREERAHAMKLMMFQNLRGGTIVLEDIKAPDKSNWESTLDAMEDALILEKNVNQALINLHKIASKHRDPQMTDFLEREYLKEQTEDIKKFGTHVTNLKRVGPGLGEYIFDKELK